MRKNAVYYRDEVYSDFYSGDDKMTWKDARDYDRLTTFINYWSLFIVFLIGVLVGSA
jgi:hypothetical protein